MVRVEPQSAHNFLGHLIKCWYTGTMKNQLKRKNTEVERESPSPPEPLSEAAGTVFPIVGIGSSAGGLEALEQFLRHVPEKCGMAFVIVQHLDPTHKGIMPELLQRVTAMEVLQVRDRMEVKADCVYVIPPNKNMSILHGVLHLFEPTEPRGLRLPIDFFLHSLAEDRQECSIGVILSGMGSDGTIGVRAIKAKGGLVLVQEPASAKFDSMPRSVIDAGLVDLAAPAEELPGMIITCLQQPHAIVKTEFSLDLKDQGSLEKVLILLRAKTGNDFSLYKKNTVYRRIERRMSIHRINNISLYVRYLQENPQEVELLFRELLIGVTSFFRDAEAWEQLRDEAIGAFFASHPTGGCLRAWSTGCSSGEEAYSLAMIFREALAQFQPAADFILHIFATDLDQDAIDKARQGVYPTSISATISPERLSRFFIKEEHGFRVIKEIREMVTFATQNVIMHPPFTRLDILICRNVLIYLTPELQKKLLPLFHYSLNRNGVLFLGSSESVNSFTDLFGPLCIRSRIFRRRESYLPLEHLPFPAASGSPVTGIPKEALMIKPAVNLQSLADQLLLQHYSPPAVLVNNKGDIIYISGRTGKYLEPAAGKANWNIFAMAREGLRYDLGSIFQKAIRENTTLTVKGVKIANGTGAQQAVDITVQSIIEPDALQGMAMIIFTDVTAPLYKKVPGCTKSPLSGTVSLLELEQELQQGQEELQNTREEMQASQEELTSTNEELQSSNEELQSTNEELTTSREEMQSLNEELQTVNAEQQSKMDELSRVNNDMRNLLNSTEIVTLFLDNQLNIRRFTTGADKLFKLIPGDVGRPLSDIVNDLNYPEMMAEAREVLRTLVFSEKQITATDGRWFSVRIMPYRTMEDVIVGVVITFANITTTKALEAELREENARLKNLLAAARENVF
jgi:two-component system CheB/CheR fusion protein